MAGCLLDQENLLVLFKQIWVIQDMWITSWHNSHQSLSIEITLHHYNPNSMLRSRQSPNILDFLTQLLKPKPLKPRPYRCPLKYRAMYFNLPGWNTVTNLKSQCATNLLFNTALFSVLPEDLGVHPRLSCKSFLQLTSVTKTWQDTCHWSKFITNLNTS